MSGGNNVPLGQPRLSRFAFSPIQDVPMIKRELSESPPQAIKRELSRSPPQAIKHEGSPAPQISPPNAYAADHETFDTQAEPRLSSALERKRKKGSRWGAQTERNTIADLMGLPTAILNPMTQEQIEAYSMHLRIEEITQKLKIGAIVPSEGLRQGKRINTREQRTRKRLDTERHNLIQQITKLMPCYRVPHDYRRPAKTTEKIYVPVNDYPEINFIGQLIGPRGQTLKQMETDSGAKIAIRGKGSVKEGKGGSDRATDSNLDEDLHCLIMADSEEKVEKAKVLINRVIETAASTPEIHNDHKRNQLRALAVLNGTLRDDENQACQNCGTVGHRKYDCPEPRNFTYNIICRCCGNGGHMAKDCPDRVRGGRWQPPANYPSDVVDREYLQLMNELDGHASMPTIQPTGVPARLIGSSGAGQNEGGSTRSMVGNAPWHQNGDSRQPSGYDRVQGPLNNIGPHRPLPPPPSGGGMTGPGGAPWSNPSLTPYGLQAQGTVPRSPRQQASYGPPHHLTAPQFRPMAGIPPPPAGPYNSFAQPPPPPPSDSHGFSSGSKGPWLY